MGDGPEIAVAADAEDLLGFAEGAAGGIVEGVLLEGAGRIQQEAQGGKSQLQPLKIGNGELKFDLGALHSKSIRRQG